MYTCTAQQSNGEYYTLPKCLKKTHNSTESNEIIKHVSVISQPGNHDALYRSIVGRVQNITITDLPMRLTE